MTGPGAFIEAVLRAGGRVDTHLLADVWPEIASFLCMHTIALVDERGRPLRDDGLLLPLRLVELPEA